MKIMDRVAIIIGVVGLWVYVASVEQNRWGHVALGAVIMIVAFTMKKISTYITDCREEQEAWEEEHRSKTFSTWIRSGSLK